jgi:hypothetical protein
VDEYNSRFAREEEPIVQPSSARRPRPRRMESNFVVVGLAGIVAVTILVVVAWKFGSSGTPTPNLLTPTGQSTQTAPPTTTAKTGTVSQPATATKLAKLQLTAKGGDSWVRVRKGSAAGELLYEGTLQQGQTQRFLKWKRLWLEMGAPVYLSAKLNGHHVGNFPSRPAIIVVTAKGVRTVSTA